MDIELVWNDWIGVAGTLMALLAFFLLQAGRISGTGIFYQLLNLFASCGILVSLVGKFNLPVFLLEGAWGAISLYGIGRTIKMRHPPSTST
ncbi:MAG: hypothetical protein ABI538_07010 [Pseudoxanthomonas sp.]